MDQNDGFSSGPEARIAETAWKHSLLESSIRNLPIPVCSVFAGKHGRLAPASFRKTSAGLTSPDYTHTLEAFPITSAMHDNIVLEAMASDLPATNGKRVAVLFSGGPAAGGHNVLAGLKAVLGYGNTLLGIRRGSKGLLVGDFVEITPRDVATILNTGGFDFLGTDRTKIQTPQQFMDVKETVLRNKLDGLVIVGGDDSNTNAAFIAEYFEDKGVKCAVVGVPKTIDGDMAAGKLLPIPFGFDTATKVYAEMVGNVAQDAASAVKYWHFVKLMGRSASKITLEVALQTKPAIALISEEISRKRMSLDDIVDHIARVIALRRLKGTNYGVVLVPEGLVEFIPEMGALIRELNALFPEYQADIRDLPSLKHKLEFIYPLLSAESARLMASLPDGIQEMLILDRDDHGNVKVSQIDTEKLLIEKVRYKISEMKRHSDKYFGKGEGKIEATPAQIKRFKSIAFSAQSHFLGYEGRSGHPSLFDGAFAFNLGLTAGSLVLQGKTGYMAAITDFDKGGRVLALPISGLISREMRKGEEVLVIARSLVELTSPAFQTFAENRERWAAEDLFSSPGPIQYWGPVRKQLPISVALDQGYADYRGFNLGEENTIVF
jgi:pyrophosphate--fructose-6-phosphate 1-phosphotransferase